MNINFDISDEKVSFFSERAKEKYKTHIKDIAEKLANEAESLAIPDDNVKEVTSPLVGKAAELFTKQYNYKKRKTIRLLIVLGSEISMALTSIFFTIAFSDKDNLTDHLVILSFAIIFLVVGVTCTIFSIIENNPKNE